MTLIDREQLQPDTEWDDYYDGFTAYSPIQIFEAPVIQAVTLDKMQLLKDEINLLRNYHISNIVSAEIDCAFVKAYERSLELIDKYIADVKGE